MIEGDDNWTQEELIKMVLSSARFDDPLVMAISNIWVNTPEPNLFEELIEQQRGSGCDEEPS